MADSAELIVMLTHNDLTVSNAEEIFLQCKSSKARYWGFKEAPLPMDQMRNLVSLFHECGKVAVLEVVSYSEEEGIEGANIAAAIGVDILMGTKYFASIHNICIHYNIKYMPFVGDIVGRPSVLKGSVASMIQEAQECRANGVDGIDLLGYRYEGDAYRLIQELVQTVDLPVCVAGSIDGFERLDQIKSVSPWAFTIGSAFFECRFPGSFLQQVNTVVVYMNQ